MALKNVNTTLDEQTVAVIEERVTELKTGGVEGINRNTFLMNMIPEWVKSYKVNEAEVSRFQKGAELRKTFTEKVEERLSKQRAIEELAVAKELGLA